MNDKTKFLKPVRRYEVDDLEYPVMFVSKTGADLIHDPLLNKGTGFSEIERDELGIVGLVPPRVVSIDDQIKRVEENYNRLPGDLQKYIFLEALHDRNETLFYRVLLDNLEELTPIVYTPVVGQACQHYGHIYRRARGMYFSSGNRGKFKKMVNNWKRDDIDIIVVTDGSRILGLGDLGANGMGIPIGKLALYVTCAGMYPSRTLPVMLDAGTNNESLLNDPLYLGERHQRLTGDDYYEMVDEFIDAVHERWPTALIQFEDFTNDHAFPLLEKYRDKILCFNDDIQGTGAVALAGILSALKITGQKLTDQKIVFLGAGSAAIGIADMITSGMAEEGCSLQEARDKFSFVDSKGLVSFHRGDILADHKVPYAKDVPPVRTLEEVLDKVKPTILLGLSGQTGAFSEEIIRRMGQFSNRPIIFALSNPTSKAECTAEQAYHWSDGKAIFASGSPFDPIEYEGKTLIPGQGNNMYIFPGVGLGACLCKASKVTNSMFYAAAKTLAEMVSDHALSQSNVYPKLSDIREISAKIASAVCEVAFNENIANIDVPKDLFSFVQKKMYQPCYIPYKKL
ncbi:MAG: NAD-dependent malic enzyme [Fidelibacterota bacterium]